MSAKKATQKSAKRTTGKKSDGFTPEERAAMKERARELKGAARKADGESAVLAKIAESKGKVPRRDRRAGVPHHEDFRSGRYTAIRHF
jgi:hypothetical protein